MFKRFVLCTALITLAMVLSLNAQPQPSPVQPAPVKRTILQRSDVPGTNLEIIYAAVEIAAGFKAGRHNHPGVAMGQVLDGDFWLQLDGQPEQVLHAGESLTIPNRAIHNEGATDKAVKLIVVYVVEKGKPLISAAQSERLPDDEVVK
jgi:quercetin dioxygenase-like cupin family protein